ncbi:MAG: FKBP-type peptidyl-prolyl cis-trans isomerase [Nanobdellota archaeon]
MANDTIKNGDFIELNYTGKYDGIVFDTTIEDVGKNAGLKNADFKPVKICVGDGTLLKGLEENLKGKELGKYSFKISPEKAFGKKDMKKVQLIPSSKFKKDNITPYPGLSVNIDNQMAIVKKVGSGRILVDFNHPLAGKEVEYDVEVLRKIDDTKEKVENYIKNNFGELKYDLNDNNLTLYLQSELPEEIRQKFDERIKKAIPELKEINFEKVKDKE